MPNLNNRDKDSDYNTDSMSLYREMGRGNFQILKYYNKGCN